MAASFPTLPALLLALLVLFARPTVEDHTSPGPSPSPSPFSGGADSPLIQSIPVSSPPSSSSPSTSPSPDLSPQHPPSPASEPASSPGPNPANSDIQDEDLSDLKPSEREIGGGDAGGGMSGGKKAAVSIGVVIGAGLVGLGAFVYKKRRENARRARLDQSISFCRCFFLLRKPKVIPFYSHVFSRADSPHRSYSKSQQQKALHGSPKFLLHSYHICILQELHLPQRHLCSHFPFRCLRPREVLPQGYTPMS
ncbi:hypothetical protein HPP92_005151 [Vanilla planifolia]|uniref:Uncharacterized protein n=1 Tax=Vanilla planifolia TaxID=51239 RepID=A0A835VBX1_VANPL|nr:hypothetical protein HPP92_005151 [Vanilla planifolia]